MFHGHPANLGIVGSFSHSAARRMIDQADCVRGVRRRPQSPHHELRPFVAQGAAHPGRCRAQPHRPLASGRRRRGGRCAARGAGPAGGAAARLATPTGPSARTRRCASSASSTSRSDFEPANTARTVDPRSLGAALEKLLPARAQSRLRRRQLPGDRALPFRAGTGPLQADQRLRLDRHGLRHGAGRGQGAARRDHRARGRRRRLPDDHGRAGDGGARGPAAGRSC